MYYMFKVTGKATSAALFRLYIHIQHSNNVRIAGLDEGENDVLVVLEIPTKILKKPLVKLSQYKKLTMVGQSSAFSLNPELYKPVTRG